MITVNGRFVARVVMGAAFAGLLVLGGFSYHSDRITIREVIGGAVVFAVAVVAALWLRLHGPRRSEGGDAGEQEPCPYDSCGHNHPGSTPHGGQP